VENDVDFSLMRGCKKEIKVKKTNIVSFRILSELGIRIRSIQKLYPDPYILN
jgi:hypothetical protein